MSKLIPVSNLESSLNKGYVIYSAQFLVYSRAIQLHIYVHGIFQARILEQVAISSSMGSS